MSLKTDYSGVCTGGFDAEMLTVFEAGRDLVTTLAGGAGSANAQLSGALTAAASAGEKVFTETVLTTFEPNNLRLNGVHQQTYFAGIIHGLALEGIFSMYISLSLNTSDSSSTSVDFNFSF
jgi:hypothetical protein